jgi:hypothetical protein
MKNTSSKLHLTDQLQLQLQTINAADNALDTKSGVIVAFSIAVVLAILSFNIGEPYQIKLFWRVSGLILLILSVMLNIFIIWPKQYKSGVIERKLYNKYLNMDVDIYATNTLINLSAAIEHNSHVLLYKSQLFKRSLIFCILSLPLLGLSMLDLITIEI